jgi:RNA polymerase sigma factor (sigma-70 family)
VKRVTLPRESWASAGKKTPTMRQRISREHRWQADGLVANPGPMSFTIPIGLPGALRECEPLRPRLDGLWYEALGRGPNRNGIMSVQALGMPSRSRTDQEPTLLERIARGDPEAVSQLIDRYEGLVHSIARGRLGADASEDLVQEVFISLWKSAHLYDPSLSSESTYITTVARRRMIDFRRKIGRGREAEEVEESLPAEVPEFDPVETADEARAARAAMDRLKPDQREVLRLAIVEGLTHNEIAERTSLPLGTVKSHARRGLERVRQLMESRGETRQEGTR